MDLTPPGDDLRPEDEPTAPRDGRDRIDWDSPSAETTFPADAAPDAAAPDDDAMPPASPDDDADMAAIWMDPDYVAPATESAARARGGLLPGILIVVLALGLVAATLWGIREYRQRAMIQHAAQEALGLISAGAPPELVKEMSAIQAYLTAGQADQAAQRLATLRTAIAGKRPDAASPGTPGTGGGAIPEAAYNDLPPDAAKFFRAHQDLFRQFLEMCAKARQLKEQGQNVDAMRKVRDQAIEAARLGQQPEVEKHMRKMAQMLGGPGGGDGRGPLGQKAEQLKRAMKRADSQGRDVRVAFPLMKKAEEAAQAGKLDEAEKYVDQALAAVRAAPRQSGRGGRRGTDFGRRPMGLRESRTNPLAPFSRALLGVMAAEEANLKAVTDALLQMRALVLKDKPEAPAEPPALSPLIDRAMGELKTVAMRRQELTRRLRPPGAKGQPGGGAQPPAGRLQQLTAAQRREMFAILLERLTPLLDSIRALPDSDYQAQRASLIREIVRAVLEPPRPEGPSSDRPVPLPADPEQRVRAKMLQAAKVLKQWELDGKDTAQVEDLFAQARKALYAKQFAEAEKLVDEARKLLGMEETTDAADPASRPSGGGIGLDDGPLKLNLRARP